MYRRGEKRRGREEKYIWECIKKRLDESFINNCFSPLIL
jgi:hypothetical protein